MSKIHVTFSPIYQTPDIPEGYLRRFLCRFTSDEGFGDMCGVFHFLNRYEVHTDDGDVMYLTGWYLHHINGQGDMHFDTMDGHLKNHMNEVFDHYKFTGWAEVLDTEETSS